MRIAAAIIAATILTAGIAGPPAHAQAPAAPAAVPEVMPFDIPYGTPINLEQANKLITAAAAEAKKHNWKMSITVVDPAGILVAHATMDGTQYASVEISQAKARTAALYRRATSAFQDAINTAGSPATLSLLALTRGAASGGGFPIVIDGKLIGAIGSSGGIFTQDMATSKAGLEALGIK
jgi:glc operon protein GlcG